MTGINDDPMAAERAIYFSERQKCINCQGVGSVKVQIAPAVPMARTEDENGSAILIYVKEEKRICEHCGGTGNRR